MLRCDLPAVRVGSKDSVFQRLWSHPPHRKQTLPSFTVVVSLIDVSSHTKVYKSDRHTLLLHSTITEK